MTGKWGVPGQISEGLPASDLDDEELERQGLRAHATRHWVFLYGTAEQFNTHTLRMLELEEEYLRRHPQRTWQGGGGADSQLPSVPLGIARVRDLVNLVQSELAHLLDNVLSSTGQQQPRMGDDQADDALVWAKVLEHFAATPDGCLHKLEVHQIARRVAPNARLIAALYRHHPPLLVVDGDYRRLTNSGRVWLAEHSSK